MNSRAYILDYQIFYIIIKYFFSRTILNQKKKQFHINFLKSKSTFGLKKNHKNSNLLRRLENLYALSMANSAIL